jgi:hypothetical protein
LVCLITKSDSLVNHLHYWTSGCTQLLIKELWEFSITIWKQTNAELRGTKDGAISMERQRKDTVTEAAAVYQTGYPR